VAGGGIGSGIGGGIGIAGGNGIGNGIGIGIGDFVTRGPTSSPPVHTLGQRHAMACFPAQLPSVSFRMAFWRTRHSSDNVDLRISYCVAIADRGLMSRERRKRALRRPRRGGGPSVVGPHLTACRQRNFCAMYPHAAA
jgi:hypothetical protein